MSIREVTLEETISLSRRLPRFEQLRLISVLSGELSRTLAQAPPEPASAQDEEEQLLADLRAAGLVVDPTPEMLARAAEYNAKYSPEEQEAILQELRSLKFDPPLSEIVIRAREFRPGWRWIVEGNE